MVDGRLPEESNPPANRGAYPIPAVKQRGTETIIPYQGTANGAGYMALDEPIPEGSNKIGSVDSEVADGADVTQGAKADAAYAGSGDGTVISILKGIFGRIGTKIDELKTGIVLAASSNIIGKVHLTDGTHEVDINADGSLDTFINNWPSTFACTQSGTWNVSVSNFPATQPVSGTVAVSNFPATQPVSGTVATTVADGANVAQGAVADAAYAGSGNTTTIGGLKGIFAKLEAIRAILAGTVTVNVSGVPHVIVDSGSITVGGTVGVSNFPSSQAVTGPLTDVQLRATAVPISAAALPDSNVTLKAGSATVGNVNVTKRQITETPTCGQVSLTTGVSEIKVGAAALTGRHTIWVQNADAAINIHITNETGDIGKTLEPGESFVFLPTDGTIIFYVKAASGTPKLNVMEMK